MTQYIIDITRFISRIGRGHATGIDRVEVEYIKEISARDPDALAVAKLGKDFILLPVAIVAETIPILAENKNLGRIGAKDFFRLKLPRKLRKARQYFRSHSKTSTRNLNQIFLPSSLEKIEYVNVGHSNLNHGFFQSLRSAGVAKITILIHDMIPLDFPEFTRDGVSAQFRNRMYAVAQNADQIICNSDYTRTRVQHYFKEWGTCPNYTVAHLGIEKFPHPPDKGDSPPYFVILGTIEPRKNHQLLFDVWKTLAAKLPDSDMPHLKIIGRRGWNNEAVFNLLDSSPLMGKYIAEHSDFNDTDLANCIANSCGLLFPSHAEGFGLPALEAAQMNVPVICSKLEVFEEILGAYGTYLDVADVPLWASVLQDVAKKPLLTSSTQPLVNKSLTIPRWESHFRHVFRHN